MGQAEENQCSAKSLKLNYMAERGDYIALYCSFLRNSLVFCHFIRKTRIFCRLRTRLSSLFRLSSALQSLLWTSKVPKKSNISNKSEFASWVYFHCCDLRVVRIPMKADSDSKMKPVTIPS
jgi:hypothetical protein